MWTCYERNLFGDPRGQVAARSTRSAWCARYAFDGDARDLSGNGANGELRYARPSWPAAGARRCASDGANDYVACSTPHAFPAVQHEISLTAWSGQESLKTTWHRHKGDNIYQAYAFGPARRRRPYFKANRKTAERSSPPRGRASWTGAVAVATGVWTHVAVTLKHDYEVKYTETN
jgi:hypothetical protein